MFHNPDVSATSMPSHYLYPFSSCLVPNIAALLSVMLPSNKQEVVIHFQWMRGGSILKVSNNMSFTTHNHIVFVFFHLSGSG